MRSTVQKQIDVMLDLSGHGHDAVLVETTTYRRAMTNRETKTAHRYIKKKYRMLWYQRLWDWLTQK